MDYSIKELCAIIKQCKAGGVTHFELKDLKLEFRAETPEKRDALPPTPEQLKAAKEYESEIFLEHEKRIRTEELSQLRLSDPEAYEDLVARGELENVGEESPRTNPG